jgi:hypothetical protein
MVSCAKMNPSTFDQVTSVLTVKSLCSRLGPDVPSGSKTDDLEAILKEAEIAMNYPSRIVDANGTVKGILWFENWGFIEFGDEPSVVDEVAEQLEPNQFVSSDTNVFDAVQFFAMKENRYFYVLSRNEIVGVLFYQDLFKPLGRLAFIALALEIEDLALRLCRTESVIERCWLSIPNSRRLKAIELFKSRHKRDPQHSDLSKKPTLALLFTQRRNVSDLELLIESTHLVDKATMIWKQRLISEATRAEVLGFFNELKEVRDQCAHPGGDDLELIPKTRLAHFVSSARRMRDSLLGAIQSYSA